MEKYFLTRKIVFLFCVVSSLYGNSELKGIALIGNARDIEKISSPLQGLENFSEIPFTKSQFAPFWDQPLTEKTINAVVDFLREEVEKKGYPFTLICAPETQPFPSVLIVLIAPAKVGEIQTNTKIPKKFRLKKGEIIDPLLVKKDLLAINRNPFRVTSAIYSAGKKPQTTDIELITQERFFIRPYGGFENTGVELLGFNRWFTGFNIAGLFDDLFTFQFIASTHVDRFKGFVMNYLLPLPNRHTLILFGGGSWVSFPFGGVQSKGKTGQASLRYEIPLVFRSAPLHQITLGADYKTTNNTLEAGPDVPPVITSSLNLFQFLGNYQMNYENPFLNVQFQWDLISSPFRFLPKQTKERYERVRERATPTYLYTRALLSLLFTYKNTFSLSLTGRVQGSMDTLIPSETLALGGKDTVRGYRERVVIFDRGYVINAELRSPVFHPLAFVTGKKRTKIPDQLIFLAFLDYGAGSNLHDLTNEINSAYLLGAGPGVRYDLWRIVSASYDLGFKLHKSDFGGSNWVHHFSLSASF